MILSKWRLYIAGLVAFLVGMPLTGKVFAQGQSVGGATGTLIDEALNASASSS